MSILNFMLSWGKHVNRLITYLGNSCDVNLNVQPQMIARDLQILEVKEWHYLNWHVIKTQDVQ